MSQILLAVLCLDTDAEAAGLSVAQVGAAADFEVLLLAGRPGLNVNRLDLQVSQVAGAALQGADRDIQRTEQVNSVLPQLIEPQGALFRLADNDHFLLLELMDAVYASLLDAVGALFLAEAGRVRGQGLGQILLIDDGIDEAADHGVFTGADQVQVFALDLVHHGVHLRKAHNAGDDVAADHEGRDAVGEAAVDHKVTGVGQNSGMQTGDIAGQIVETVAGNSSGAVQINAVEGFHDLGVVGDLEIGHNRLAVALYFDVFTVILTDGNGGIDDVGDDQQNVTDLLLHLLLHLLQLGQTGSLLGDLFLHLLGFLALALCHQAADALGDAVSLGTQVACFLLNSTALSVQLDDFIDQGQLGILEFLFDVFLDDVRVLTDKFDVQHDYLLLFKPFAGCYCIFARRSAMLARSSLS